MSKPVIFRKVLCIFPVIIFLMLSGVHAQDAGDIKDINPRAPKTAARSGKAKEAQKKKIKQKKASDKAIEKGKKQHEKIQTREVRKRMKKSKHTAATNNAHKREFFLKRWFQKKHRTKNR
ncbi:MAG: hypothetical protein ABI763_00850 [Bacteroidota bacterium]